MSTRILLSYDHAILRQGLRSLVEGEPGLEVVGEAGNGRAAVALAGELRPDVVVMDVAMPDLNGMDATRQITSRMPGVRVIGLSIYGDRRRVAEMFQAGASGYLIKDQAFEELAVAIRAVAAGKVYLSPAVAGEVVGDYVHGRGAADAAARPGVRLTPREQEVLQLMAGGKATKQVAMILHVSIKTVETHRRLLMEKLVLHSVAELTKYAIREGLTTVEV